MRETYLGESQTKLNDADSFRVNVAATQVKITTISCVLGRNRYTTTILKYRRRRIASHFRSIKTLHTTYCAAACLCLQWIQFLTIWICSTLLNSLCFSAAKIFTKYRVSSYRPWNFGITKKWSILTKLKIAKENINQNMTPFDILKVFFFVQLFFVQYWKVEFQQTITALIISSNTNPRALK